MSTGRTTRSSTTFPSTTPHLWPGSAWPSTRLTSTPWTTRSARPSASTTPSSSSTSATSRSVSPLRRPSCHWDVTGLIPNSIMWVVFHTSVRFRAWTTLTTSAPASWWRLLVWCRAVCPESCLRAGAPTRGTESSSLDTVWRERSPRLAHQTGTEACWEAVAANNRKWPWRIVFNTEQSTEDTKKLKYPGYSQLSPVSWFLKCPEETLLKKLDYQQDFSWKHLCDL